jgi:hypothetical protein
VTFLIVTISESELDSNISKKQGHLSEPPDIMTAPIPHCIRSQGRSRHKDIQQKIWKCSSYLSEAIGRFRGETILGDFLMAAKCEIEPSENSHVRDSHRLDTIELPFSISQKVFRRHAFELRTMSPVALPYYFVILYGLRFDLTNA